MSFIARLAGTGLHHFVVPLPRKRWKARLKSVVLSSMLPAHPFPGVGGERSETEGGGPAELRADS